MVTSFRQLGPGGCLPRALLAPPPAFLCLSLFCPYNSPFTLKLIHEQVSRPTKMIEPVLWIFYLL